MPAPPAHVLEVGAGRGELAARLAGDGYDVLAIDPSGEPPVRAVSLIELDEPAGSFDAGLGVVSLHHVEPLRESFARLAEVVRPGGALVIDELDAEQFDERAARWWIDQRRQRGLHAPDDAAEMVRDLRHHVHPLELVTEKLSRWFDLAAPERCSYLHRWDLDPELQPVEEELIARGELPTIGARIVGRRKETSTRRGAGTPPRGESGSARRPAW